MAFLILKGPILRRTKKILYPVKGTELEDFSNHDEMSTRGSDIINKLLHAAARCRTDIQTADMMPILQKWKIIDF